MSEIKVTVCSYGPGRCLVMRYTDPLTGKRVAKSAETDNRTKAERAAARWEADLNAGRYAPPSRVTWEDFQARYLKEGTGQLRPKTVAMTVTAFKALSREVKPVRLADVTGERLSRFCAQLRERKLSEATVRSYLAHLRAALGWAVDVGMLPSLPKFPKTANRKGKGKSKAKGRPVTAEEFERMLGVVPTVVGNAAAESWRHLLTGLWWSGLRLGEALSLRWDGSDCILVDLSGEYPMLRIPGDQQKSGRDQLYPVAPEFAEFLLATPEAERRGRVFRPIGLDNQPVCGLEWVSARITEIGKAALVKVSDKGGKVKWASAHDLRRSFGQRWAPRVMPVTLMELMRHSSIETTMQYYVGMTAQSTAEIVWAAFRAAGGNTGNTLATLTTNGGKAREGVKVASACGEKS